jgi:hypothetical protein
MNKAAVVALLALPFLAVSARANDPFAPCFPYRIQFSLRISPVNPCCPAQLGPWYQYWPMEAHFQNPAPMGYPYWPSALQLPTPPAPAAFAAPAVPAAPVAAPAAQPARAPVGYYGAPANGWQPVSYSYGAPAYWYGR